jgi:hypothetical protein
MFLYSVFVFLQNSFWIDRIYNLLYTRIRDVMLARRHALPRGYQNRAQSVKVPKFNTVLRSHIPIRKNSILQQTFIKFY